MHEMSIAVSLIDLAAEEARKAGAEVINRLEVEVGALAGVEVSALTFCFASASQSTPCQGAELEIINTPGRGRCLACGKTSDVDSLLSVCPACGAMGLEILQGQQLRLRSLSID